MFHGVWWGISMRSTIHLNCTIQEKVVEKDQSMRHLENLLKGPKMTCHPASGCFYTRSNWRIDDHQRRRLDRIVVNDNWVQLPSFSRASFLEPGISDHSPSILQLFKIWECWSKTFLSTLIAGVLEMIFLIQFLRLGQWTSPHLPWLTLMLCIKLKLSIWKILTLIQPIPLSSRDDKHAGWTLNWPKQPIN